MFGWFKATREGKRGGPHALPSGPQQSTASVQWQAMPQTLRKPSSLYPMSRFPAQTRIASIGRHLPLESLTRLLADPIHPVWWSVYSGHGVMERPLC